MVQNQILKKIKIKIISVITNFDVIRKILKHLGFWNQGIHLPAGRHGAPPLPNMHPPSGIDSPVNVESFFQDFLPPDLSAVPGTGR
jgi:hypothetical protein